jgi:hypothetical protein
MRKWTLAVVLAGSTCLPLAVAAEETTWSNVPVVDSMCLGKVKANPDAHKRTCLLQCSKSGYGLVTQDGTYLKFDEAGNEKTMAALKASKKEDHVRATVKGTKEGDTIKVDSITLD